MYPYLGDFAAGSTIFVPFHTFNSSGASVTLTGLAVTDIEVYKGASMTQRSSDAGYALVDTDGIDLDTITGIHGFTIDTSDNTDASFYAAGNDYTVVVSAVTVDSQTVNFIAARFSIENRVSNVTKWLGTAVATPTVAGVPEVDLTHWLGTAAATPTVAGVPEVDLTHVGGATTNVAALATNVDAILADTGTDGVVVATGSKTGYALSNAGVDAIWDEAYSGHLTAGSVGAAVGGAIAHSGTVGAGGNYSTTVELPSSGRVADDDYYNNMVIEVIGGTGIGQSEFIADYVGATGVATLNGTFATTLDGTSVVQVRKFGTLPGASAPTAAQNAAAVWDKLMADHQAEGSFGSMIQAMQKGTAQAGASSTITLDATGASATTDFYKYAVVEIISGTGAGQSRQITAYNGTSKVATVDPAWTTAPSTDSNYVIKGLGIDAATTAQIAAGVWNAERATYQTAGSFGEYVIADATRVSGSATAADALEAATTGVTPLPANVTMISGDSVAADNAEAFFDGTGYAGTGNTIPSVTTVTGNVDGSVGSVTGAVGSVTGAVGSVTGAVGSVTGNVGGNVTGSIGSLAAQAKADVNAEVVDALITDTYAEPVGVPAATSSIKDKINWLFALSRNKRTQTATTQTLRNDADGANIGTSTHSDDATTYTRGEWS